MIFGLGGRPPRVTPELPSGAPPEDLWTTWGGLSALRRASDLLPDLGLAEARELVTGVARLFFAHVVDLPASEKHHHSEPFGLYAHSLETAEFALRGAASEHFAQDTRAYPEEQEFRVPRLRYATWLWGLLHDSGKVAHVEIRAGHDVWNPYDEPLEEFYRKCGRPQCTLTWRIGRGLDIHTWHNAYLLGRLLSGRVARYLGPRLTGQLIEKESPLAREVLRLVEEADHRSTRESIRQPASSSAAAPGRNGSPFIGGGEFLDQIPRVFESAIARGTLKTQPAPGDVVLGRSQVLIRYPASLEKLAFVLREALGSTFARARALTASESGARELARLLHERRLLYADPETDAWKVKAKLSGPSGFDVTEAVLVDRAWLAPTLGGLPVWEGAASFVRCEDETPLRIEGWNAPPVPPARVAPPSDRSEASPSRQETAPALIAPAPLPRPAQPLLGVRRFISPDLLLSDIREAILDKTIPSNGSNRPCYVLEETTYLVSPRGLLCLVDRGLYTPDPKRELNLYLDALAKCPAVRKKPGGIVLTQISVRPGARPLWVIAFETRGLFQDPRDLAKVGFWTESSITELTEEEARAVLAARALDPPADLAEAVHA
jgi:hypothetical protein